MGTRMYFSSTVKTTEQEPDATRPSGLLAGEVPLRSKGVALFQNVAIKPPVINWGSASPRYLMLPRASNSMPLQSSTLFDAPSPCARYSMLFPR